MEHFDVLIVGAGLSGIGAAHRLQSECPWADYAVLESRGAIGGTWDLFRYPGIRSDSEMHTLGYSFRPWSGAKSIAAGDTIRDYIIDTAAEAGIDRHILFHHRVVKAQWSSEDARWLVTAQRLSADLADTDVPAEGFDPATAPPGAIEEVEFSAGFLYSCTGYYRYDRGYTPEFAGIDDFTGQLVHPQFWPEDLDVAGREVVVIGSGATAVTLVPALARQGAHVTMLQRSPTYMASVPTENPLAKVARNNLPERVWGPLLKWQNALFTQASYRLSRARPEVMRKVLRKRLEMDLPEGFDIDKHFTPDYNPWDQRLCAVADGDLFKALADGSASIVTDTIDRFTPEGIRVDSGEELRADVVISATGLDLLFLGGMDLYVDGDKVDPAERLAYRGMMLDGVPNLAIAVGYTNASWTLKADLISDYVARLLNYMHDRGLRQCTPVNEDSTGERAPLLDLAAGYVQRSVDRFPKQGRTEPWMIHQSYITDWRNMRNNDLLDGTMRFSNPDTTAERRFTGGVGAAPLAELDGAVAAVTGAASGIGRALAVELSKRGCHLALADLDEVGLAETVGACEGAGVKVTSRRLDVADRDAVFAWADEVVADHGRVNLVVNNAGVALGASIEKMSIEDFEWLMNINFWGVVHGTQAFLPHLERAGAGHVVNISSVFGLLSIPSQSAYNASKFAVRGFTDALRIELEIADNGVSSTTVHPGGIRTNIARSARVDPSVSDLGNVVDQGDIGEQFDRIARTSPRRAALRIIDGVQRNKRRVLIGPDAVMFDVVSRLPAGLYQRVLARGAKRLR